jgi:type VI secretion system protein ImpL
MPRPFNDMLLAAANSFENTIANDTYRQINEEFHKSVVAACQSLVPNHYPLERGARTEIGLADFGRVFGGNGYFERFFKQYLEPYADTTQREWKWRQDNPVAKQMSAETLRQFQRAAQIRDAFFATGGNVPSLTLTVTPPMLPPTGQTAKLEIGGVVASSSTQPNPAPVSVPWPGGGGKTAISLVQDPPPTIPGMPPPPPAPPVPPIERAMTGQWALFRLLDFGSISPRPNGVAAEWSLGGRFVQFQIGTGTIYNPLQLPALREFRCPASL